MLITSVGLGSSQNGIQSDISSVPKMPSSTLLDDDRTVNELMKRGAKTFGSEQRRVERLDRFLKFEQKKQFALVKSMWKRQRAAERDMRRSDDVHFLRILEEGFPSRVVLGADRDYLMESFKSLVEPTPIMFTGNDEGRGKSQVIEYEPNGPQDYSFCAPILVVVVAVGVIHLVAGTFTLAMWVGRQNGFSVD